MSDFIFIRLFYTSTVHYYISVNTFSYNFLHKLGNFDKTLNNNGHYWLLSKLSICSSSFSLRDAYISSFLSIWHNLMRWKWIITFCYSDSCPQFSKIVIFSPSKATLFWIYFICCSTITTMFFIEEVATFPKFLIEE
jgi:hypothetical protein